MTGRRSRLTVVLVGLIALLAIYVVVGLVLWLVGGRADGVPRPPASSLPVLDGTRPIDERAVAGLARERAGLGARWLAGATRPDGSFF